MSSLARGTRFNVDLRTNDDNRSGAGRMVLFVGSIEFPTTVGYWTTPAHLQAVEMLQYNVGDTRQSSFFYLHNSQFNSLNGTLIPGAQFALECQLMPGVVRLTRPPTPAPP